MQTTGGSSAERVLVQIFAKAPARGEVKTRLIPSLGVEGATELHRRLLRHALATVAHAGMARTELWTTPPGDAALLQTCGWPPGETVYMQPDGDLGVRMSAAMADGLERAPAVLLVGADVPSMRGDDLLEACEALANGHDAVLGPTEDGGYWLIGLSRRSANRSGCLGALFLDVPWSTPGVLQATRERLCALRFRWHELPVRWDVDRPEDVQRMAAEARLAALVADLMQPA